jgi:hypothetical protein
MRTSLTQEPSLLERLVQTRDTHDPQTNVCRFVRIYLTMGNADAIWPLSLVTADVGR